MTDTFKFYTACIKITGKKYAQMSIHEKINCKSYYEIFKDRAYWSLDHLMNWMLCNRIYNSNFSQPYRSK